MASAQGYAGREGLLELGGQPGRARAIVAADGRLLLRARTPNYTSEYITYNGPGEDLRIALRPAEGDGRTREARSRARFVVRDALSPLRVDSLPSISIRLFSRTFGRYVARNAAGDGLSASADQTEATIWTIESLPGGRVALRVGRRPLYKAPEDPTSAEPPGQYLSISATGVIGISSQIDADSTLRVMDNGDATLSIHTNLPDGRGLRLRDNDSFDAPVVVDTLTGGNTWERFVAVAVP